MAKPTRDELIVNNLPLVYLMLRRGFGNCLWDSDNLISVGMAALIRAAERFDPSRAKFSTYACCVIVRSMKAWIKKEGLRREYGCDFLEEDVHDCRRRPQEANHHVDRPSSDQLMAALEELPARERHVLHMRTVGGQTLQAIANDYGLSKERIRQIQLSAVARVRKTLENVP